jgi:hypothetical protein
MSTCDVFLFVMLLFIISTILLSDRKQTQKETSGSRWDLTYEATSMLDNTETLDLVICGAPASHYVVHHVDTNSKERAHVPLLGNVSEHSGCTEYINTKHVNIGFIISEVPGVTRAEDFVVFYMKPHGYHTDPYVVDTLEDGTSVITCKCYKFPDPKECSCAGTTKEGQPMPLYRAEKFTMVVMGLDVIGHERTYSEVLSNQFTVPDINPNTRVVITVSPSLFIWDLSYRKKIK